MRRLVRHGSKSARNEGRKLVATFLNNIGVAFILAALLQPLIGRLQNLRGLGLVDVGATFLFVVIGIMFRTAAQRIISRLKD